MTRQNDPPILTGHNTTRDPPKLRPTHHCANSSSENFSEELVGYPTIEEKTFWSENFGEQLVRYPTNCSVLPIVGFLLILHQVKIEVNN